MENRYTLKFIEDFLEIIDNYKEKIKEHNRYNEGSPTIMNPPDNAYPGHPSEFEYQLFCRVPIEQISKKINIKDINIQELSNELLVEYKGDIIDALGVPDNITEELWDREEEYIDFKMELKEEYLMIEMEIVIYGDIPKRGLN